MIRAASIGILVGACSPHATKPPEVQNRSSPIVNEDACELIAAILGVPEYQRFYDGTTCGEPRSRPFVKVVAHSSVVPMDLQCSSRGFILFRGQRDVRGQILVLEVGGVMTNGYGFNAKYWQPNVTIHPNGTSSFDDYSCVASGTVVRENGRWVAHASSK